MRNIILRNDCISMKNEATEFIRREIQQGEIGFFVLALRAVVMEENYEQVITMYSSHVQLSGNLSHHLNSITQ